METTTKQIVDELLRYANRALDAYVAEWNAKNPSTPIHRDYETLNNMKSIIATIDNIERLKFRLFPPCR